MKRVLIIFLVITGLFACKKGMQDYRHSSPLSATDVSTYDFLKQQGGLYDTLLLLIDRVHLTDTLKSQNITFFVPQDNSIQAAIRNLNYTREKMDSAGNWTIDSIPLIVWDSLLRRYMLRGNVTADSLNYADGSNLVSLYGREMNGKTVKTNASGAVGGGTVLLQYSDKNNSRFVRNWSFAYTQNADIKTKNGIIHILEERHVFGFNSFTGMAFPKSLEPFQGPYLGFPIPIPGIVNAADFDEGPVNIAYRVANASGGHAYRPDDPGTETCSTGDAQVSKGGLYNVGWTTGGDWLRYTVDIAEAGDYEVNLRTAGGGDGIIYLEIDGNRVSPDIPTPSTGGWQTWRSNISTCTLPQGKHFLFVRIKQANLNLHRMIFKKL
ncbi:hypothetical protein DVR12_07780 [Chitinophaga silvatica]|uniref:Fasciclin domain-containing protein n=1 Tax=Chitinophaga silvatica TaxID=2282649 RepID=A0A3E1YEV7_9BACT|nr:carbohydrate-binding protein [Chitinophaga silvatica]RFS25075.1 hypothetical protein DVR12_07780 [Chitinophaga silvatica]